MVLQAEPLLVRSSEWTAPVLVIARSTCECCSPIQHKIDRPWRNEAQKAPGQIRWRGDVEPYFTESGFRLWHRSQGSVEECDSNAKKEWTWRAGYIAAKENGAEKSASLRTRGTTFRTSTSCRLEGHCARG